MKHSPPKAPKKVRMIQKDITEQTLMKIEQTKQRGMATEILPWNGQQ